MFETVGIVDWISERLLSEFLGDLDFLPLGICGENVKAISNHWC